MDITLTTRHLERSDSLVDLIRRRAGFTLGRFADLIRRLEVRLTDINGPRGGNDVDCVILAHLATHGRLVVAGRAASAEAVACDGIDRLAGVLRRHLDRLHDHRRHLR